MACLLVFLTMVFDVVIRTEEDLEIMFPDVPIIGVVPGIDSVKANYYRSGDAVDN